MSYKNYLKLEDSAYRLIETNIAILKRFSDHDSAEPMVIISTPAKSTYTTPALIDSPELMLKAALDGIKSHIDCGDDYIPQMRVEFGTGQVAHAYGCGLFIPEHSPVCAKGHVLDSAEAIVSLEEPSLDAGLFGKAYSFTEYFMSEKPSIVGLQIPDLQSPFNNAHLIRGNDILFDFYDEPELLELLLKKLTNYQVKLTDHYRRLTFMEDGYFYDWGTLWKGSARLSDCSLHMISTEFYNTFVKKYDIMYLNNIKGGRIHYCGDHDDGLIDSMCDIEGNSGLDLDSTKHDLWEIATRMPKDKALLMSLTPEMADRILDGDIPAKRNLILWASAPDAEQGRILYQRLKEKLRT